MLALTLSLLPLALSHAQAYSPGATLVYNVTTVIYYPNVTVVNYLYIMKVEGFVNTSFVNTSLTVVNLNEKLILPSIHSVGNASAPPLFFYISPSLLGDKVIWRGTAPLYLNKSNSSGYLYWSASPFLQGTEVLFYMFILKNGTVAWAESVQVSPNGKLMSVTTYRLWLANYSGPVRLNLEGFKLFKPSPNWEEIFNNIFSLILVFGVSGTIPLGYYLYKKGYMK